MEQNQCKSGKANNDSPGEVFLKCDLCRKETDTVFTITVYSVGDRDLCAKCYLSMLPNPDRTVRY